VEGRRDEGCDRALELDLLVENPPPDRRVPQAPDALVER